MNSVFRFPYHGKLGTGESSIIPTVEGPSFRPEIRLRGECVVLFQVSGTSQ